MEIQLRLAINRYGRGIAGMESLLACSDAAREDSMRPASILLIAAVLIAALFVFDAYEYDGYYRHAVIEQIDHFGK